MEILSAYALHDTIYSPKDSQTRNLHSHDPNLSQVPPATQVEGGRKPAYGTLGKETRKIHWSTEAGGLVAFRRTDDRGRTMWGIDTGGGRLNRQKRAERRQIGRKERGDGNVFRARNPDESWRGGKERKGPNHHRRENIET